jgi:glycosyltransferase involved in cell wall biosynthesis
MRLLVTSEHRYDRTPDGAVWTTTNHAYPFWARYLAVFEGIRVVARVRDVSEPPLGPHRADGRNVTFISVPFYIGPMQYLLRAWAVRKLVASLIQVDEAVILRVGSSQIANCLEPHLMSSRHPFGVEVIGDPYEVFAPGVIEHPLRPFLRWWFTRRLRSQCGAASGAAYVTQTTLQKRYPCRGYEAGVSDVELDAANTAFATSYSSVELPSRDGAPLKARAGLSGRKCRLISVATLAQDYKGIDVLIGALAICRRRELDIELTVVGDGKYRSVYEQLAARLGIKEFVHFRGHVASGSAVRNELDLSDVFVLASKTEGLPRAIIEAMARGLPCIASAVGGIPELLSAENLVPPGDAQALADKIQSVVKDPNRMARMSADNLKKSEDFRNDVLEARRNAFYTYIKDVTERWVVDQAALQRSESSSSH